MAKSEKKRQRIKKERLRRGARQLAELSKPKPVGAGSPRVHQTAIYVPGPGWIVEPPEHEGPEKWPTQKEAVEALFAWVRAEGWEPRFIEDESFYLDEEVEGIYLTPVGELGELPYNCITVGMYCTHGNVGDALHVSWYSEENLWVFDERDEGERLACNCGL